MLHSDCPANYPGFAGITHSFVYKYTVSNKHETANPEPLPSDYRYLWCLAFEIEILKTCALFPVRYCSDAARWQFGSVFVNKTEGILLPCIIECPPGLMLHQDIPCHYAAMRPADLHAQIDIIEMKTVECRFVEAASIEHLPAH